MRCGAREVFDGMLHCELATAGRVDMQGKDDRYSTTHMKQSWHHATTSAPAADRLGCVKCWCATLTPPPPPHTSPSSPSPHTDTRQCPPRTLKGALAPCARTTSAKAAPPPSASAPASRVVTARASSRKPSRRRPPVRNLLFLSRNWRPSGRGQPGPQPPSCKGT
jgi:hypothetical protein